MFCGPICPSKFFLVRYLDGLYLLTNRSRFRMLKNRKKFIQFLIFSIYSLVFLDCTWQTKFLKRETVLLSRFPDLNERNPADPRKIAAIDSHITGKSYFVQ